MLISVVIPTYNRLPILRKCLNALENQFFIDDIHDYEIVIVDDGSTDGTTDWLRNNLNLRFRVGFIEIYVDGLIILKNLTR